MQDTLHANDVLLNLAGRSHEPVLENKGSQGDRHRQKIVPIPRTKELVVFSAYESTKPTRPASTPVVTSAATDRIAVTKIMVAPTNSSRTASQRLIEILRMKVVNKQTAKSIASPYIPREVADLVPVNAAFVVLDEHLLLAESTDRGQAIQRFGEPSEDGRPRDSIETLELARGGQVVTDGRISNYEVTQKPPLTPLHGGRTM